MSATIPVADLSDDVRGFLAREAEFETVSMSDALEEARGSEEVAECRQRLEVALALWVAAETGSVEDHLPEIVAIVRQSRREYAHELDATCDNLRAYVGGDNDYRWSGHDDRAENLAIYRQELARLKNNVKCADEFLAVTA